MRSQKLTIQLPLPEARRLRWVPFIVLLLGLLATVCVTWLFATVEAEKDRARFAGAVQQQHDAITERLNTHIAMLRGVAGYMTANENVRRYEFKAYVDALNLPENYPGVLGVGYTQRLTPESVAALEQLQQRQGYADYKVWPDTPPREEYHAIIYLEPLGRRNAAAIGFDMFTEPVRAAAMVRARDTGEPAMTGRVTLVQEIDHDKQPGLLIYIPVYSGLEAPTTLKERRDRLQGYAYSALRSRDLFSTVFRSDHNPLISVAVYDQASEAEPAPLLYLRPDDATNDEGTFVDSRPLRVAGRIWRAEYRALPAFDEVSGSALVPVLLFGGLAVSLLLAGLSFMQARAQAAQRLSARALQEYREAVYREEKLYRLAVEQVRDYAIFLVSPDGAMGSWNDGVQKVLGWDEQSFIGQPIEVVFPDEDKKYAEAELRTAREKQVASNDRWQVRKDGTRFWASGITNALYDEGGRFVGYLKVMRDLTENRLHQQAIEAHEKQLRLITDTLPVFIAYLDSGLRYRFVNRIYERWFGWPPGALLGRTVRDLLGDEAFERLRPYLERALTGELVRFTTRLGMKGRQRDYAVIYSPDRDAEGRVIGFAAMAEDITERKQAEERARTILESITDAFYALDREWRFTYVNQLAVDYLRRPQEALLGQSVWELYPALSGSVLESEYRRAMTTQTPVDFEWRSTLADVWMNVRVYPSEDGLSVYFHDITAQKRAEEERAHQARTLGFMLDLNLATAPLTDPGEITALAARMLGQHLEADRCAYAEFDADEDGFVVVGDYTRSVESAVGRYRLRDFGTGIERALHAYETYASADLQSDPTSADNAFSKLGIRAVICAPLVKAGKLVAALAVHQMQPRVWTREEIELVRLVASRCWEAIERARVARNLTDSEARFRAVVETTPEFVKIIGRDGAIQYINKAGLAMLGVESLAEVRGQPLVNYIAPPHRALWQANHERVCAGEQLAWQFEIVGLDGTHYWMETHAVPITMGDEGVAHLGVTRDITDAKRIEREREQIIDVERAARAEAERVVRMKDEFLATLSHELRTPLSAVLGWAQLLRRRVMSEADTAAALEAIERNAKAQQQLIEDLLDMSRIISGKVRLEIQPVRLPEVIDAALDVVRPMADAKRIRLVREVERGVPAVNADPNRLQQVLWNLLTNAIKFTPSDGQVIVRLHRADSALVLQVADTGAGMSAEFLPQVFDRFRQHDSSTTRAHGGLGLGLSIVKSLVELHGGSVDAESAGEGQGATFTVVLPIPAIAAMPPDLATANDPHAREADAGPEDAPSLAGLKILVVDDEADARELVRRMLVEYDAQVDVASGADEAMACLAQERYTLIISDVGMPNIDGYALMRRIRELRPELGGRTPAIALTAFARADDRYRALAAGFQMHIAKPVDPVTLVLACARMAEVAGGTSPET